MILHLGVVDIPYASDTSPARTSAQVRRKKRNDVRAAFGLKEFHGTTGDVAEILEARYHIMEIFAELHMPAILDFVETSIQGALENLQLGAPQNTSITAEAESEIEADFKRFLSLREMDDLGYPGIPTAAAQRGVSHRFAHPYAKRASRPSFIDTGTYQNSFKVWTDN